MTYEDALKDLGVKCAPGGQPDRPGMPKPEKPQPGKPQPLEDSPPPLPPPTPPPPQVTGPIE